MKKYYLFAKFYKKNTFFSKFLDFFIYIAKKKKIPVVNKYHQNKVLSVSKNAKKLIWVQCCMTTQLSFKV
ncbi:unnamed protein product [Staurois parvus]|uniref:Uncharacterized protein n=1 Tax=Staurois parvus TaxID=386267 RepID=A0ABN9H6Z7_9NEOB|nr:unnamed protein product [Staurois parvus]